MMHTRLPRASLLILTLSALPAFATLLVLLSMRCWAYCRYVELTFGDAVERVAGDLGYAVQVSGPLGVGLVAVNYVACYGIPVVLTVLAARWWPRKRVVCFYIANMTLLMTAALLLSHDIQAYCRPVAIIRNTATLRYSGNPFDNWAYCLIKYPPYALPLALLIAWLVSMLPIFRHDARRRLERGLCPRCRYDLKGEVEAGCPECGWNRSKREFFGWARTNAEASLRSATTLLVVGWTVLALIAGVLAWPRIAPSIPMVTTLTPQAILKWPKSEAYSEAIVFATIEAHTGWFGLPGERHCIDWGVRFIHDTAKERARQAGTPPDLKALMNSTRTVLADVKVDAIAGTVSYHIGEAATHENGPANAAQLAAWLEQAFPDAEARLLVREADAIMEVIGLWKRGEHPLLHASRSKAVYRQVAIGGTGWGAFGVQPPTQLSRWGVALVVIGLALPWLYVTLLIVRWARRRRRAMATP